MTFWEILTKYPKAAEFFAKKGWGCFGCPMAAMETLEQGAKAHGLRGKDLDKLIKELQEFLNRKKD